MAELRPFEQIDAGGVDSRSNPINMPRNRALRCLNWCPKQAGYWELRYGYSTVSMSTVSTGTIHTLMPLRLWNGNKYVLFVQGTTLKTLDTATGTVTTPAVRGAAVASSAKGAGVAALNRMHYGNGTDQKWFDGTTWRTSGLPALTAAQIQNVAIYETVRELATSEASTVTLTAGSGGSFPADTLSGHLVYVVLFAPGAAQFTNEIGPATISVGSGRIKLTLNQKFTVANMLSILTGWVKLIAGTADGSNLAYFYTNTSTAITSCTRSGQTLTVISPTHGLSSLDVVTLSGTGNFDGVYSVTVSDGNTFTVVLPATNTSANTTGGTAKRIVSATAATASVDVLAPTQDTSTYQANQNGGLAASTIGGATAGYQFYASIYNPNGGGHVGNRIAIGPRFAQTAYRTNVHIYGLPDLSGTDSEWCILIGRTGDGAAVPYAVADNANNWLYAPSGQTTLLLSDAAIDGQHELPTRNGIIPPQCNMFALVGNYVYAGDTGSPYLRRSGSIADFNAGIFTGRPEQSWAGNDLTTFQTGEALTNVSECYGETFCATLSDCDLSVNSAGIEQWVGPWAIGCAGRRAATKCGSHGFYWITGDKQLATLQQGVPVIVSEEYELAELAQIGDAYLATVECAYYRNAAQEKDELRIEFQRTDGSPYTVIHNFKLREIFTAPGSVYGQGHAAQFQGPLANTFSVAQVRDGNGTIRVFAGSTNGYLYQLYSGADDAGAQYSADLILLQNGGPSRPNVPFIDFYGDSELQISVGRNLMSSLAAGAQWGFEPPNDEDDVAVAVPGSEQDFLYRVFLIPPEVQRLYVRFQLTSHSGDGNLNYNSPPHVPLESYGRLYEIVPAMGDERSR